MHYSVIAGWFGDHMLMPPGKFFTMFHFLEYPFSRGFTHIVSPNPYEAPDFDAGFMNDKRDVSFDGFPANEPALTISTDGTDGLGLHQVP
jgi:hypothetical protein